jgi:hypothetical protein
MLALSKVRNAYLNLFEKNIFTNALATGVTATLGLKAITSAENYIRYGDVMISGGGGGSSKDW